MKRIGFLSLFILAACNGQGISLEPYADKNASPQDFYVCHGFGCKERTDVKFTEAQWKKILAPFKKRSKDAAAERSKIAKAIGQLEKQVIANTGMGPDKGEARTFQGDNGQMDCRDEAINTSLYVKFLEEAGILKFNKAYEPVHRGFFVDGQWPHNSGAVKEIATGEIYVIDSYYFDAGHDAAVVPLGVWLDEWRPAEIKR